MVRLNELPRCCLLLCAWCNLKPFGAASFARLSCEVHRPSTSHYPTTCSIILSQVLMNLYKRVYPKWKYAEGVAPALE